MGVFIEQISGLLARLLPSGGTAGQVLRKATGADYDVGWGDYWTTITEANDLAMNSTTATATGLTFSATANTTYEIEAFMLMTSSTSGNPRVSLTAPSGATCHLNYIAGNASGANGLAVIYDITQLATLAGPAGSGSTAQKLHKVSGLIRIGATAGTVTLNFASSTGATTITIKARSFYRYRIV